VCAKSFSQSSNLITHGRRHAAFRPFTCPLCGHTFHRRCDAQLHLERDHAQRTCTSRDYFTMTTTQALSSAVRPPQHLSPLLLPPPPTQSLRLFHHLAQHTRHHSTSTLLPPAFDDVTNSLPARVGMPPMPHRYRLQQQLRANFTTDHHYSAVHTKRS